MKKNNNMSVYLDYNATSPMRDAVKKTLVSILDSPANASSIHSHGRLAKKLLDEARLDISELVNCNPDEIIFTSGGTESNTTILKSHTKALVSSIEHDAVLKSANNPNYIKVGKNGQVDLNDLEEKIKIYNPDIVSVMWANNETGVIQPINEVVAIAKKYDTHTHCDAVQAIGKIPINFHNSGLDSMSISSHKIGGPSGVGALIIDKNSKFIPLIIGGGQEKGRRSGTENFIGILGFSCAAKEVKKELKNYQENYLKRKAFEEKLLNNNPKSKIICFNEDRLPNTTAIYNPVMPSETQVIKLDLMGFSVSAGSACSSGKINKSHVLKSMGLDWASNNTIRISYGWQNNNNDLDRFVDAYKKFV